MLSVVCVAGVQAQAPLGALPAWETTVGSGLTLTKGNSDTLLFTAELLSERKWLSNEASLGTDGSYGESRNVKNVESAHAFGQFNRLFGERWFTYARVETSHDAVAAVAYRVTLSPGAGYYFLKTDATRLGAEIGPGYVFERKGGLLNDYATLRAAERFEHKLNSRAKFWQTLEIQPQMDQLNNFTLQTEIGVEAGLTKKFRLRSYLVDTYINVPALGRKANDVKLVTGVVYKF